MIATLVKDLPPSGSRADQKLYKLSEPYDVKNWDGVVQQTIEYVVTSAVVAYSGPETYVFAADENGKITNWSELPGSFRGSLDHNEAIEGFVSSVK